MIELRQRSIEIILQNQSTSGAYIACPNMDDYAYSWFRDGAFIAYSMDIAGEHESAARFYEWGARVINERAVVVERAVQKVARGERLGPGDYLHTRYTLDGREGSDDSWPNFQLDGIGTWLWGMAQHVAATGSRPSPHWLQAAQLAARYLDALWCHPNYDLWEEFGDEVHTYSLAAIYAGLRSYTQLSGDDIYEARAAEVRDFVLQEAVADGQFIKYLGNNAVDASLLGLATPYGLVSATDERMKRTVARIEAELRAGGGGVQRYGRDSYYGGGEWLLLAAWLGWYHAEAGHSERAAELLDWVAAQSDGQGWMPEQIPVNLIAPDYYEKWVEWRGPIATPLLWSHAMYLITQNALHG
jgi:GH15 family glucan-1,4-alpha-glucosidase